VQSLPAHPLPLYFGLASVATLGVLVLLLRRGAPPGTLLAAFCVLRPAAKLALEPLRAPERGGFLMVVIPGGVLAVTCGMLAGMLARRVVAARAARIAGAARGDELLAR
jgi:prolipoprotein diacylglyceryltransferase